MDHGTDQALEAIAWEKLPYGADSAQHDGINRQRIRQAKSARLRVEQGSTNENACREDHSRQAFFNRVNDELEVHV